VVSRFRLIWKYFARQTLNARSPFSFPPPPRGAESRGSHRFSFSCTLEVPPSSHSVPPSLSSGYYTARVSLPPPFGSTPSLCTPLTGQGGPVSLLSSSGAYSPFSLSLYPPDASRSLSCPSGDELHSPEEIPRLIYCPRPRLILRDLPQPYVVGCPPVQHRHSVFFASRSQGMHRVPEYVVRLHSGLLNDFIAVVSLGFPPLGQFTFLLPPNRTHPVCNSRVSPHTPSPISYGAPFYLTKIIGLLTTLPSLPSFFFFDSVS